MTAEEIRREADALDERASRYDEMGKLGADGDIQLAQARFLAEIAAQLAELNKRLEAGSDGFNVNATLEPSPALTSVLDNVTDSDPR